MQKDRLRKPLADGGLDQGSAYPSGVNPAKPSLMCLEPADRLWGGQSITTKDALGQCRRSCNDGPVKASKRGRGSQVAGAAGTVHGRPQPMSEFANLRTVDHAQPLSGDLPDTSEYCKNPL